MVQSVVIKKQDSCRIQKSRFNENSLIKSSTFWVHHIMGFFLGSVAKLNL